MFFSLKKLEKWNLQSWFIILLHIQSIVCATVDSQSLKHLGYITLTLTQVTVMYVWIHFKKLTSSDNLSTLNVNGVTGKQLFILKFGTPKSESTGCLISIFLNESSHTYKFFYAFKAYLYQTFLKIWWP